MTDETNKDSTACERCSKNPATVHVRRVAEGKERELHVCKACAKELGADPVSGGTGSLLSDPVTLLFQSIQETSGRAGVCPGCGSTYSQFKETGRLGCSKCYEAYAQELTPLLRQIHGRAEHLGKRPLREGKAYEEASRIKLLTEELDRAVHAEDYERAAKLRDRLRSLGAAPAVKEERHG